MGCVTCQGRGGGKEQPPVRVDRSEGFSGRHALSSADCPETGRMLLKENHTRRTQRCRAGWSLSWDKGPKDPCLALRTTSSLPLGMAELSFRTVGGPGGMHLAHARLAQLCSWHSVPLSPALWLLSQCSRGSVGLAQRVLCLAQPLQAAWGTAVTGM